MAHIAGRLKRIASKWAASACEGDNYREELDVLRHLDAKPYQARSRKPGGLARRARAAAAEGRAGLAVSANI